MSEDRTIGLTNVQKSTNSFETSYIASMLPNKHTSHEVLSKDGINTGDFKSLQYNNKNVNRGHNLHFLFETWKIYYIHFKEGMDFKRITLLP